MSRYKKTAKLVTPDQQLAAWCAALAAPPPASDIVPDGWLSATQLAEKIGVSLTEARRRANRALLEGKLEAAKFRVVTGSKTHRVTHYRIV